MKKILLIISALFLIYTDLLSQPQPDSLEYIQVYVPLNLLSTSLNKQINTYNLNSGFMLNHILGNTGIRILEDYNSTFIQSGEKNIRDEQYLMLSSTYELLNSFNLGIMGTSNILSDNRRIEINQASVNTATFFMQFNPYENLYLTPFAGYANNRQIGEIDYGPVYGAEGALAESDFEDLILKSSFKFRNEDISPRKNTLRLFYTEATNYFNNDVSNNIRFRYSENRKDFYYTADSLTSAEFGVANNIESRTEKGYIVEDVLRLNNFLSIFSQEFNGGIAWRDIDRNTRYRPSDSAIPQVFDPKIDELLFNFESNTIYTSRGFNAWLQLLYFQRDEKHVSKKYPGANDIFYEQSSRIETSKNNNSTRLSISLQGDVTFSKTDKLYYSMFQNKLKYDTPSELNFDDRDEILSIVRLKYSKMLTPFLEAFIIADGTYSHIVYIFSERSSNNNVNRIINFSAGGNYRGKNFTSANAFTVSANYTTYDFEDLNPTYRSFSFRQMTATDSTRLKLDKTFTLMFYGYIKLSEQGDFSWSSFATRPTRFIREIYAEPKMVLSFSKLFLSGGMRFFSVNSYNYRGIEQMIDTKYLSIGPLAELLVTIQDSLYVRLYTWYEFITVSNSPDNSMVNLNFQMNWNF